MKIKKLILERGMMIMVRIFEKEMNEGIMIMEHLYGELRKYWLINAAVNSILNDTTMNDQEKLEAIKNRIKRIEDTNASKLFLKRKKPPLKNK